MDVYIAMATATGKQQEEKQTTMATATYYLHSMFFMLSVRSFGMCVCVCARCVIYLIFKFLSLFPLMESAGDMNADWVYIVQSQSQPTVMALKKHLCSRHQSHLFLLLLYARADYNNNDDDDDTDDDNYDKNPSIFLAPFKCKLWGHQTLNHFAVCAFISSAYFISIYYVQFTCWKWFKCILIRKMAHERATERMREKK